MRDHPDGIPIGLFEHGLNSHHGYKLRSGRDTHESALRYVAKLVQHTTDAEFIRECVRASLPEGYNGNTIDEVAGMVKDAIKKGFDAPPAKEKKRIRKSEAALAIAQQGIHLFRSQLSEGFAEVQTPAGGRKSMPIKSSDFAEVVRYRYFKATNELLTQTALTELTDLLEAKAKFEGAEEHVYIRVAGHDGDIYFDLGRRDGQVVHITPAGWEITSDCPVRFWQPPGAGPLPLPVPGDDLSVLQTILGLDHNSYVLLLAFILACLNPKGPYLMMLVQGEQGSGKSFLCSLLKQLLDPSAIEKLRMPNSEHDLAIQASHNYLLVFDNASTVRFEMSDALCALSTGAGFSTRKYYTDNEARIFKHMRPIVINGIGEFANRPDLIERAIQLKLKAMPNHARRTERQLQAALEHAKPAILAALFDVAVVALRNLPLIDPPTTVRMADAAARLVAAEPATDLAPGAFLMALEGVQEEMMADRAANDPLVIALLNVIESKPQKVFSGSMAELHREITGGEPWRNPRLPPTPSHLSNALQRLAPMMRRIGVRVELLERSRKGRAVRITIDGEVPDVGGPM